MCRYSLRSVLVATSRICPASSTPVGPAPTRAKVSQRDRSAGSCGGLGQLERAEDPPPDLHRVLDGLHPGRDRGVLVVPEIGLPDAGGQDEVVVAELDLLAERAPRQHPPPGRVQAGRLGDDELDVAVLGQQLAQRRGDLTLGQDAGRALVQHRLEQVMLGPVDEGHLDRRARQHPGGEQPREAAAHDHHPALAVLVVHAVFRSVPCGLSPPGRATCPGRAAAGRPRWDPSCPGRRGARGRRRRGPGRRPARRPRRCPAGRTASDRRPGPRR